MRNTNLQNFNPQYSPIPTPLDLCSKSKQDMVLFLLQAKLLINDDGSKEESDWKWSNNVPESSKVQPLYNIQYISQSIKLPVISLFVISQTSYSIDWIVL